MAQWGRQVINNDTADTAWKVGFTDGQGHTAIQYFHGVPLSSQAPPAGPAPQGQGARFTQPSVQWQTNLNAFNAALCPAWPWRALHSGAVDSRRNPRRHARRPDPGDRQRHADGHAVVFASRHCAPTLTRSRWRSCLRLLRRRRRRGPASILSSPASSRPFGSSTADGPPCASR